MKKSSSRVAVIAVAATLALSACSGDDSATFESTAAQQSGSSASSSPGAEATSAVVEPAKGQTIEVNETKTGSNEDRAFSLTVHKVVIHDYYVETEITLVNDGAGTLNGWQPSEYSGPQMTDDGGRKYVFQGQPDGKLVKLLTGEGANAVLVHAGRVDPGARTLTLDFTGLDSSNKTLWSQITFDVPLGAN